MRERCLLVHELDSIDQLAVAYHVPDTTRVANIGGRIGIEKHEVGPLPYFDRAEFIVSAEYASGRASARMNRLERRQSRGHQLLQFHVHAGGNLPNVGARADVYLR